MRDRAWSGGLGCHGDKIDFIRRSWEATGRSDPGGVDFTVFLQRWAERQQNQLRRCWREAWQSFLRRTNKSLARERGRGHWRERKDEQGDQGPEEAEHAWKCPGTLLRASARRASLPRPDAPPGDGRRPGWGHMCAQTGCHLAWPIACAPNRACLSCWRLCTRSEI